VGLGVAADLMRAEATHGEPARLAGLRDRLLDSLLGALTDCRLTGSRTARMPHHLSLAICGAKSERMLRHLDLAGVAASSGSACSRLTRTPSHVLRAIGCTAEETDGSIALTLGRWTTPAEVDAIVDRLPRVIARLRASRAAPRAGIGE